MVPTDHSGIVVGLLFLLLLVLVWQVWVRVEEARYPTPAPPASHQHVVYSVVVVAATRQRLIRTQDVALALTDRWPLKPFKDLCGGVWALLQGLQRRPQTPLPLYAEHPRVL